MGGALAAISTQVVGLDSVSFELSANALVMLVLGGIGTLYGALVGTVIFMGFEHIVSAINPFHWMTMVGALADRGRARRAAAGSAACSTGSPHRATREEGEGMSDLFRVEDLTKTFGGLPSAATSRSPCRQASGLR